MVSQALFFACGIGALGLILILISALGFQKSWASTRWPSTTGQVIESCVNCRSDGDVPLARYQAKIVYRYTVHGKEYTSSRISFQSGINSAMTRSDDAEELVNQYPHGKAVTVFYHPQDPEYAVLQPGSTMKAYMPLVLGGLLFVISLISMMFAFI